MIYAVDPSLTATCIASPWGELTTLKNKLRGPERLVHLRDRLLNVVWGADRVGYEGYSFGSKGQAVISLGELGGIYRVALWEHGIRILEVPPGVLKKFATGNGNAKKEQMIAEAIRRLGYTGHSDDEADALWLREMWRQHYDVSDITLPKSQLQVLEGLEWPPLAHLTL